MRPVGSELVSTELHRDVQPLPVKSNASVRISSKIKLSTPAFGARYNEEPFMNFQYWLEIERNGLLTVI